MTGGAGAVVAEIAMTGAVLVNDYEDSFGCVCTFLSSSTTIFPSVETTGNPINYIVFYVNGDTPGTNDWLLIRMRRDYNYEQLDLTPDGDNISVQWGFNDQEGWIWKWNNS